MSSNPRPPTSWITIVQSLRPRPLGKAAVSPIMPGPSQPRRARFAALLAVWALAGCESFEPARYATVESVRVGPAELFHGLPVETGQIVVNEKPGGISLFLSLVGERFEPWIHAGIVVVEDGRPWVYEAFGLMMPNLSGNPNDGMRGGVRRVSLESLIVRGGYVEIHDPPAGVDRQQLAAFARQHHRARTRFDAYFDASDPSRLYCVEFVARAVEASGGMPVAASGVNRNASLRVALDWLKIDADSLLLAGTLVAPQRRVIRISREDTPEQMEFYFAMKRELHRRFTTEQKLGSLLQWKRQNLRLRAAVAAYYDAGMAALAADAGAIRLDMNDAAVELAASMFGSVRIPGANSASDKVAQRRE